MATILTGLLSFMLEKSPTLGSVATSDYEKRVLAARSHEFNLRSKVYCELFPELADASRKALAAARRDSPAAASSSSSPSSSADPSDTSDDPLGEHRRRLEGNQAGGALTNFLVIGGFAAFAFVVQYVVQSIAAAD